MGRTKKLDQVVLLKDRDSEELENGDSLDSPPKTLMSVNQRLW